MAASTAPPNSITHPTAGSARSGTDWTGWCVRVTSTVSAVLLANQAVFAGQFLAGTYPALHTHRENATLAGISVIVSMLATVAAWRPGRRPWWPIAANAALFGLIAVQIIMGFARILAVHIPLGVTIIGAGIALAIRAWRVR